MTLSDGYSVPKGLVNSLIISCLTAIVVIGAYMVAWNSSDRAWKQGVDLRLDAVGISVSKIETKIGQQILPEAKWRLNQVEDWMETHESTHHKRVNP